MELWRKDTIWSVLGVESNSRFLSATLGQSVRLQSFIDRLAPMEIFKGGTCWGSVKLIVMKLIGDAYRGKTYRGDLSKTYRRDLSVKLIGEKLIEMKLIDLSDDSIL